MILKVTVWTIKQMDEDIGAILKFSDKNDVVVKYSKEHSFDVSYNLIYGIGRSILVVASSNNGWYCLHVKHDLVKGVHRV